MLSRQSVGHALEKAINVIHHVLITPPTSMFQILIEGILLVKGPKQSGKMQKKNKTWEEPWLWKMVGRLLALLSD